MPRASIKKKITANNKQIYFLLWVVILGLNMGYVDHNIGNSIYFFTNRSFWR